MAKSRAIWENVESWSAIIRYKEGLEWEWKAIDGATTKTPLVELEKAQILLNVVKKAQKGVGFSNEFRTYVLEVQNQEQ